MEDHSDFEVSVEKDLEPCFEFINKKTGVEHPESDEQHRGIEGTLVVCTAGMSRSATVCMAYLIRYHHMSYD